MKRAIARPYLRRSFFKGSADEELQRNEGLLFVRR
jgi:hypothetical protein